MSKHSKIPISTNLKNQGYSSILFKAKNSSSTIPTVLKDQIAVISSDQNSETSNFFNYDTKPRKHKHVNTLHTSTGSYNSCKDNIQIYKIQHAPSFSKSDDSSSDLYTNILPKKLTQSRDKNK